MATTRKDRAVTALETERGHPLLAHWQYGLGRVVAWTSDAQRGWASRVGALAGRGAVLVAGGALVAAGAGALRLSALGRRSAPDGRRVTLSVQALRDDGHFADLQDTRATVVSPNDSAREVGLAAAGAGQYALDTRVSTPGSYRVLFRQGQREEVAGFQRARRRGGAHGGSATLALLDPLAQRQRRPGRRATR